MPTEDGKFEWRTHRLHVTKVWINIDYVSASFISVLAYNKVRNQAVTNLSAIIKVYMNTNTISDQKVLVISAHAVDFVWRCGGAMARYSEAGSVVRIVDLSFGERGESAEVWKSSKSITVDEVKAVRKQEAMKSAEILGADIRFLDFGDHPLVLDEKRCMKLVDELRDFRPTIVLTHHTTDPLNNDHPETTKAYLWALRCAQVSGVNRESKPIGPVKTRLFEPDQPEFCDFKPDTFIDITPVMDRKIQAMTVVASQNYLVPNYIGRAQARAYFAQKISGNKNIKFAEAYQRFEPYVGTEFV
jgi:4-oxalomesaconate hydratase